MIPSRSFWKRIDVLLFFGGLTIIWIINSLFLQWNFGLIYSSLLPHYNHCDLSAGNNTLGVR